MKDGQQNFDSIFHSLSRVIIIVPIVIVFLAVFLKLSGSLPLTKDSLQVLPSPTLTQPDRLSELSQTITSSKPSLKFNLQGPLICSTGDTVASMSAYILDKNMLFTINEKKNVQNILLKEDCLYMWKEGLSSGEKICGVSQYVSLAEGFLSSGLIDLGSIFENVSKMFTLPSTNINQTSMKLLFDSCVQTVIPKSIQFDPPNNILFKNKEIKLP